MSYFSSTPKNVTAVSTGTVVADRLICVTVNTGTAASVFKIYDGTTAAGTLIATVDASSKGTLTYLVRATTHNLFYAMSGANSDVTFTYD